MLSKSFWESLRPVGPMLSASAWTKEALVDPVGCVDLDTMEPWCWPSVLLFLYFGRHFCLHGIWNSFLPEKSLKTERRLWIGILTKSLPFCPGARVIDVETESKIFDPLLVRGGSKVSLAKNTGRKVYEILIKKPPCPIKLGFLTSMHAW